MSLRCCIPSKNLRIFSRCVQCINKLTEEFVYIQVYSDGLVLKCVNVACSAFANFAFGLSFFLFYDCSHSERNKEDSIGDYKLLSKGLYHVFKSLGVLDKSVEACIVELEPPETVTFILECKHGIVKQFKLPIIDFEILKAFCKVDSLSNSIACNSKLISSSFNIFPKNEEINMILSQNTFTFRNYDGGINNLNSSIHTQTTLDRVEFYTFDIQKETELVFCCREFRSILLLATQLGQDLDISFDSPGQPILIKLKSDKNYELTFIISTNSDTSRHNTSLTHSNASPMEGEQISLTDELSIITLAESSKKMADNHRSFNTSLFDFDTDILLDPISCSNNPLKNGDMDRSIFQVPILIPKFREEVLTDMNDDYYNNFLDNAIVLADESDDEQFAL